MIVIQKVVVSKGRLFIRTFHNTPRIPTSEKSEIISPGIEIQLATKLSAHTSFR